MEGPVATEMASQPQKFSVYVGNIPYSANENEIGRFFSTVGHVVNVRFVYDRETRRPKGFGFCDFSDLTGAQAAVQNLNGSDFNGRTLRVNYANKC
uniref:RRM domain-containing protein n=1 Tax=Strongyloides papillosus TaxID=174720 RepID=A0A0N5B2E3_STREA